jgi:hypothetical protein
MSQFFIQILIGIIVTALTAWFGIGGTTRVVVHGTKVRRSGKWIIFLSVIAIIAGLSWAGSDPMNQTYGYTLAGYGVLAYITGRIIAWFQKL